MCTRAHWRALQVRSYEQFIAYLAAKAPGRIRQGRLDFGGRNIVLYTLPDESLPRYGL